MENPEEGKEIVSLKARIEKLQSQKDSLLKELDQTEERLEKTEKLYRKYFPYIIDLAKEEHLSFSSVLDNLSTALKKGASFGRIEYIFKQLHELMLKEDPTETVRKKGAGSLFSGIFKPSGPDYILELKAGYIEIVNRFKSIFDPVYFDKLNEISLKLTNASTLSDLMSCRDDLFQLFQKYLSEVSLDREKIASFVQEIVKKILEIESFIAQSYKTTTDMAKSSENFDTVVNSELKQLKTNADVTKTLEDLKAQVTNTLSVIESALKEKIVKDRAIKTIAEKNRQIFLNGFAKLKKELKEATSHSKELEAKLNQDPLTGAFNRRAYNRRIEDEFQRFLRYQTTFSLLVIDADHFKKVNDNYGHAIGDKCLMEIIRRTKPHIRKSDMLARYGGEEFVVIMPETDGEGALKVAEKIRETIEKIEFIYKEETVRLTVSIGASQVNVNDSSQEDIFDRADTAVYQAKEAGRNRVVLN